MKLNSDLQPNLLISSFNQPLFSPQFLLWNKVSEDIVNWRGDKAIQTMGLEGLLCFKTFRLNFHKGSSNNLLNS